MDRLLLVLAEEVSLEGSQARGVALDDAQRVALWRAIVGAPDTSPVIAYRSYIPQQGDKDPKSKTHKSKPKPKSKKTAEKKHRGRKRKRGDDDDDDDDGDSSSSDYEDEGEDDDDSSSGSDAPSAATPRSRSSSGAPARAGAKRRLDEATSSCFDGFVRLAASDAAWSDWRRSDDTVVLKASPAARARVLGLSARGLDLSMPNLEALEAIARHRAEGVLQTDLARELGRTPKQVFYPIKFLWAYGLVERRSVLAKGPTKAKAFINTKSIRLWRFTDCPWESRTFHTNLDTIKHVVAVLGQQKDHTMPEALILANLRRRMTSLEPRSVKKRWRWVRDHIAQFPQIECYRGVCGTGSVVFWRLSQQQQQQASEAPSPRQSASTSPQPDAAIAASAADDEENEEEDEAAGAEVAQGMYEEMSLEQQILQMIASSPGGLHQKDICESLGLKSKVLDKLISELPSRYGIVKFAELVGKSTCYRLMTPQQRNQRLDAEGPGAIPEQSLFSEKKRPPPKRSDSTPEPPRKRSKAPAEEQPLAEPPAEQSPAPEAPAATASAEASATAAPQEAQPTTAAAAVAAATTAEEQAPNTAPNDEVAVAASEEVAQPAQPAQQKPQRVPTSVQTVRRQELLLDFVRKNRIVEQFDARQYLAECENGNVLDQKIIKRLARSIGQDKMRLLTISGLTTQGKPHDFNVFVVADVTKEELAEYQKMLPSMYFKRVAKRCDRSMKMRAAKETQRLAAMPVERVESLPRRPPTTVNKERGQRMAEMIELGFVRPRLARARLMHTFLWSVMVEGDPTLRSFAQGDKLAAPAAPATGVSSEMLLRRFLGDRDDAAGPQSGPPEVELTQKRHTVVELIMKMSVGLFLKLIGACPADMNVKAGDAEHTLVGDLPPDLTGRIVSSSRSSRRFCNLIHMLARLGLVSLDVPTGAEAVNVNRVAELSLFPRAHFYDGLEGPDKVLKREFAFRTAADVQQYWKTLEFVSRNVAARVGTQTARHASCTPQSEWRIPQHLVVVPEVGELFVHNFWSDSIPKVSKQIRAYLVSHMPPDPLLHPLSLSEAADVGAAVGLSAMQVQLFHQHICHRRNWSTNRMIMLKARRRAARSSTSVPRGGAASAADDAEDDADEASADLPHVRAYKSRRRAKENAGPEQQQEDQGSQVADGDDSAAREEMAAPAKISRPRPIRRVWAPATDQRLLDEFIHQCRANNGGKYRTKWPQTTCGFGRMQALIHRPVGRRALACLMSDVEEVCRGVVPEELPRTVQEMLAAYKVVYVSEAPLPASTRLASAIASMDPEMLPAFDNMVSFLGVTETECDQALARSTTLGVISQTERTRVLLASAGLIGRNWNSDSARSYMLTARFWQYIGETGFPEELWREAAEFQQRLERAAAEGTSVLITPGPTGGAMWQAAMLSVLGDVTLAPRDRVSGVAAHGAGGGGGAGAGDKSGKRKSHAMPHSSVVAHLIQPEDKEDLLTVRSATAENRYRRLRADDPTSLLFDRSDAVEVIPRFVGPLFDRCPLLAEDPAAPLAPPQQRASAAAGEAPALPLSVAAIDEARARLASAGRTGVRPVADDSDDAVALRALEAAGEVVRLDSQTSGAAAPFALLANAGGRVTCAGGPLRPYLSPLASTGSYDVNERLTSSALLRLQCIVMRSPGIAEAALAAQVPLSAQVVREMLDVLEAEGRVTWRALSHAPAAAVTLFSSPEVRLVAPGADDDGCDRSDGACDEAFTTTRHYFPVLCKTMPVIDSQPQPPVQGEQAMPAPQ
eukprot:m51a1_g12431 hypothetical protein (1764) ;mRNA; r:818729-824679